MKDIGLIGGVTIVLVWVVGTIAAFWYFEGQYLRPVPRPTDVRVLPADANVTRGPAIQTDQGILVLGPGQPVTLLNFWNPDCACSRFTEGHVQRLMQMYGPRGVRIITVIVSSRPMNQENAFRAWRERPLSSGPIAYDAQGALARKFGVWAAPVAVILDTHGHVSYVGAYNAARFCDIAKTAWAQKALDATLRGQTPPHSRTLFFGRQILR